MIKQELLRDAKPILFNTEMVRAILEGRKGVTRRKVKQNAVAVLNTPVRLKLAIVPDNVFIEIFCPAPYEAGDVLYVRETWTKLECTTCKTEQCVCYPSIKGNYNYGFAYKADTDSQECLKWHPSNHMPKEAAQIFLRVTNVTVERLRDITEEQAKAEGVKSYWAPPHDDMAFLGCELNTYNTRVKAFSHIWNSTIRESELDRYGWDANPWVWVIEFERVTI